MEYLLVDTGLERKKCAPGARGRPDLLCHQPLELSGDTLVGHSLDNRASVAAVTACLEELQPHAPRLGCVRRGDRAGRRNPGRRLHLALRDPAADGVAIDVTMPKARALRLAHRTRWARASPSIGAPTPTRPCSMPSKHQADRLELPYTSQVYPSGSGTDAMGMQIVAEGHPHHGAQHPAALHAHPGRVISYKDVPAPGACWRSLSPGWRRILDKQPALGGR
jgi:tetrahedral aminopeptidase